MDRRGFWQRSDPFPPTKPNGRSPAEGACDGLSISPGAGVIRSENFEKYAGRVSDVAGVAIYRPRPNEGVKAEGAKPGG
jgi:hypothetical protein